MELSVHVEMPSRWHYINWSGGCSWELYVELCLTERKDAGAVGVTVDKLTVSFVSCVIKQNKTFGYLYLYMWNSYVFVMLLLPSLESIVKQTWTLRQHKVLGI